MLHACPIPVAVSVTVTVAVAVLKGIEENENILNLLLPRLFFVNLNFTLNIFRVESSDINLFCTFGIIG